MIEAKNLKKIYSTKKGVKVNALDDVSVRLPDTGMVFILGKSGSGKSTLLNVLGGLDNFDSGEIIIKGQSSKEFKQSHFDSYRNTYIGFIFQEYNILEEFTVGANIALAIELQGRKATNEEINSILEEVDLSGLGSRKPNELSGGQKQRVAIARALVKKPEIIMADEPTGALDSNTGRQVFDTLKELSKKKLVLIVSHDREFSELYADRIIELADGKIISDVEYDKVASENEEEPNLSYEGKEITIKDGYQLTDADIIAINEYIKKIKSGATLVVSDKRRAKIFKKTDESAIPQRDSNGFKLIKSRLSIKNAFKLGSSGLKHKKVRLVFTILLSFIAFTLFGLADSIASYDNITTCTESMIDSGINYASFIKATKYRYGDGDNDFYWERHNKQISQDEIKEISKATDLNYIGVLGGNNFNLEFSNELGYNGNDNTTDWSRVYTSRFYGIVPIDENLVDDFDFTLYGELPKADNEIVITKYVYDYFTKRGYLEDSPSDPGNKNLVEIRSYDDLIGKTLTIHSDSALKNSSFIIVGILDTGIDSSRYEELAKANGDSSLFDMALSMELSSLQSYSLHACLFMYPNTVAEAFNSISGSISNINSGSYTLIKYKDADGSGTFTQNDAGYSHSYSSSIKKLSQVDFSNIAWLGEELTSLNSNQIIISIKTLRDDHFISSEYHSEFNKDLDKEALKALIQEKKTEIFFSDSSDSDKPFMGFGVQYYAYESGESIEYTGDIEIVGIYLDSTSFTITSDDVYEALVDDLSAGEYAFAIAPLTNDKADIRKLVEFHYNNEFSDGMVKFFLKNSVTEQLSSIDEIFDVLSQVFLYVGIGFAVFASLMLSNFIATSISHKKQEIGILRAIGSRSRDVFMIFFAESFIIAMINFVLSIATTLATITIINNVLRNDVGMLITFLTFGPRQIFLLLGASLLVALVATFLPVKKIASMKPIDAIKNRK